MTKAELLKAERAILAAEKSGDRISWGDKIEEYRFLRKLNSVKTPISNRVVQSIRRYNAS
jgi:hypothetical protein